MRLYRIKYIKQKDHTTREDSFMFTILPQNKPKCI